MNYKVEQSNGKFLVKETRTDQIIGSFNTHKAARVLMKHLNLGGGFDGWSPTFITKKVANI